MATSSTLKTLKEQDGPIDPRDQPVRPRSSALAGRLLTWRQSIWRRRWLSVATAWLICVAGWAVIMLWPTSYGASALVYADLVKLTDEASADEAPKAPPVARLKSMLLSEDALDEVRNEVSLEPAEIRALGNEIRLRSTVPTVFALAYEHEDPDTATRVLETVITAFENRLETISSSSQEAATALDREIGEARRRLQTAEAELVAFKRNNADHLNGAIGRAAELAFLEEEIDALERQVKDTIEKRDEIAATLAQVREPAEDAEADAPRSIDQLQTERRALEDELSNLRERYADSHPYVAAVFEAIKGVDAEVTALRPQDGDADPAPVDRQELEQRHGELIVEVSAMNSRLGDKRRQIELLQALTRTTTSVEAELSGLEAGKGELEAAVDEMQQRREELETVIGGEAKQEAFRLIRQPEPPTDPVGPSRLMALAAVLLGGVGLGAMVAVICNRYKGVFESAWQLRQRFDVGVLGTISEVLTPAEQKRLDHSRLAFGAACLALLGAFGGLAIAEFTDSLAPLGDQLRAQLMG